MANGSEGLFDHREDPGEWNNLADNTEYEEIKKRLQAHLPKINVPGHPDNPISASAVMPATLGQFVRVELPMNERFSKEPPKAQPIHQFVKWKRHIGDEK